MALHCRRDIREVDQEANHFVILIRDEAEQIGNDESQDIINKEIKYHKVILMGRLTADPELRQTLNGLSVTSFSIAVDRAYGKETDFFDVVAWKGGAEFVCKHFRKGSMIALSGTLQTRTYEDKNGNKRKVTEIVAENVSFCGGKKDEETPAAVNISVAAPNTDNIPDDDENDLPF